MKHLKTTNHPPYLQYHTWLYNWCLNNQRRIVWAVIASIITFEAYAAYFKFIQFITN